jgi:hypothetical protein
MYITRRRHIDKAREQGGATAVTHACHFPTYHEFIVRGRSADYCVWSDQRGLVCSCPAGRRGRGCWHAGAVELCREDFPAPEPVAAPAPTNERCAVCGEPTDEFGRCLNNLLFATHDRMAVSP